MVISFSYLSFPEGNPGIERSVSIGNCHALRLHRLMRTMVDFLRKAWRRWQRNFWPRTGRAWLIVDFRGKALWKTTGEDPGIPRDFGRYLWSVQILVAWQNQALSKDTLSTYVLVNDSEGPWGCPYLNVSRRYYDLQASTRTRNRFLAKNSITWHTCIWMKYIELMATPP